MTKAELLKKANGLPESPGVYIMLDRDANVIYVGKSKKLCNRVSSYFTGEHLPKVQAMADKVDDFNFILVDTEFDALILENSLIKRYMPHYNILLRDDKGYPFIRIDLDAPYPNMSVANKKREGDTARYFGPYGGHGTTKQIISSVCRALRLPDCGRVFPRDIGKERPCLHYHTGDCEGWCLRSANGEEYRERIDQAVLILEGRSAELLAAMKGKMLAAADELKFEYAASLRDRMKAIEEISNAENELSATIAASGAPRITKASLVKTSGKDFRRISENTRRSKSLELLGKMLGLEKTPERIEAFDISNLGSSGIVAGMTVFAAGSPRRSEYRRFRIRDLDAPDDYASMHQAVLRRFQRLADGDAKFSSVPDLLLIDGGAAHASAALAALKELGMNVPVFGMVKDDRHRTRALVSPYGEEIGIAAVQSVFALVGRMQEETHRFAIEYQRKLRYENYGSELDAIPGIGPARKAELLKHFKSVKAIRQAEKEQLLEVLPQNAAEAVYSHFNKKEGKE